VVSVGVNYSLAWVLAAAGAGGWYFFLCEESGGSPESPGESFSDALTVSEGTHGPYQITRGENHYFAVDLEQGDRLTATIRFQHDQGDLDLSMYGPKQLRQGGSATWSDDESDTTSAGQSGTHYINPLRIRGRAV